MAVVKYIFDSIERILKYFIDNSKLSLKKIKVILFTLFVALFAYNYFIKVKSTNNNWELTFDPGNVPVSSILITASLVFFLVIIDLIDNHLKSQKLLKLIASDKIPLSLKEKLTEELIKTK